MLVKPAKTVSLITSNKSYNMHQKNGWTCTARQDNIRHKACAKQDTYSAMYGSWRRTRMRCVHTDRFNGSSRCSTWTECSSTSTDGSSVVDMRRTFSKSRLRRLRLDDDVLAVIHHQQTPQLRLTDDALSTSCTWQFNPVESRGNYSATSNKIKLVHWPLMGGLLHLVQRGEDWAGSNHRIAA